MRNKRNILKYIGECKDAPQRHYQSNISETNKNIKQFLPYVEVDIECYCIVNIILTDADKCMSCISCHFGTLKALTLRVDYVKLLDVLTLFHVSHALLPRAKCFASSRSANGFTCSYISGSGQAYETIRR